MREELNLSDTDTEILRLLALELSESEIAGEMGLNVEALGKAVESLCAKAGVGSLIGLMMESARRGWI